VKQGGGLTLAELQCLDGIRSTKDKSDGFDPNVLSMSRRSRIHMATAGKDP